MLLHTEPWSQPFPQYIYFGTSLNNNNSKVANKRPMKLNAFTLSTEAMTIQGISTSKCTREKGCLEVMKIAAPTYGLLI